MKKIKHLNYLLLILSYCISILIHSLLNTIPIDMYMLVQCKQLFNEFAKAIIYSITISVGVSILSIGILAAAYIVIKTIKYSQKIELNESYSCKVIINGDENILNILNPFLYRMKTKSLLE